MADWTDAHISALTSADSMEANAAALAYNIQEAVFESNNGQMTVEDIHWVGHGSLLNHETRRGIVDALKGDLYIDERERQDILCQLSGYKRTFTSELLWNLQDNPPRNTRIAYLETLLGKPGCRPGFFSGIISYFTGCVQAGDRVKLQQELARLSRSQAKK
ncbi:MAG: hypothetical protein HY609_03875 [Deltaproteobacteria bacterium]|nr:hypothetical protein [Deltaproteobacteria bacterium]MBI4224047.1 hypothetical protein [Deltaproteobacteria bacterium]